MITSIALAGNPNCGKTTLFNELTGANQYVGNWPGVTVEKKEGPYRDNVDVSITDLPGLYSLSPYSPEEIVARDFLLSDDVDAVINVVDATNLERNLFLTTQLLTLGVPVVVALNMMDVVEKHGDRIDVATLSSKLGCPVVEISALKARNIKELMENALAAAQVGEVERAHVRFSDDVERALSSIEDIVGTRVEKRRARWFAIKCFEGEELSMDTLQLSENERARMASLREAVEQQEDDDAESIITNERYDIITTLCAACVTRTGQHMSLTQKIDRVVTSRVLGIPIFIVIMFLVYFISVSTVGTLITDWVNDGLFGDGWLYTNTDQYELAVEEWEAVQDDLSDSALPEEPQPADYGVWHAGIPVYLEGWLESLGADTWVTSLILDGIVAGVGAVLGFVPQLMVLFILLGFLEGCGYMARVAFVMDRVFRRFGLSGKSFIPMLISSGCGVPGVMATKTIENERDRRMTIMTTTMIPCGAKLPIIALVFGALAGDSYEQTWWVAPLFYFLGLAAIIISCIMLKKFKAFAGEVAPFIMELPQYHLPTAKNVLLSMWERVKSYIVKAGTIIFISSMIIWFLLNFGMYEGQFGMLDSEVEGYLSYSIMAGLGSVLAWIFTPLGFGSWEAVATTITGLVAKENVVATVGIITSLGEGVSELDLSLWERFATMFDGSMFAIAAFCAFNLLCAPCFAAIGAIRTQLANRRWFWLTIAYMTIFAWCVGLLIYQFGALATGETTVNAFTALAAAVAAVMLYLLFRPHPEYRNATKPKITSSNSSDSTNPR